MDNILLLIKRRNQVNMKRNYIKKVYDIPYKLKSTEIILEKINKELINCCYNEHKGHDFVPQTEEGMYGETFYICCICGYEKL